jgi:putative component of toxin-antitoxin plasmid stabilization module
MRVSMTEVYREWINDLKDRTGRARIQMRVVTAIRASIAISPTAYWN